MNDKWACWYQKVKGICHAKEIAQFTFEIEETESYLKVLENNTRLLSEALQSHYLTDLMKIDAHYVDGYALVPDTDKITYNKIYTDTYVCHLSPNTCQGVLWYKTHLKEGLRRKVSELTTTYNQLLSLCKQLQYFKSHEEGSIYNQCFLKLIDHGTEKLLLYSPLTMFMKGLPEKNTGRIYLFTTATMTQEAPESFVSFTYSKGILTIDDFCIPPLHRGLESVYITGVETFAKVISPLLTAKRFVPITQLYGQLGKNRYVLSAVLRSAYHENAFESHGKYYPDGTYLPHHNFSKYI